MNLEGETFNKEPGNIPKFNPETGQLDIDFEGERRQWEIEEERKRLVKELKWKYPMFFKEENLIREGKDWRIVRLGAHLSVDDWIKETEKDVVNYENRDRGRYYG
jgi:hypothetical protein